MEVSATTKRGNRPRFATPNARTSNKSMASASASARPLATLNENEINHLASPQLLDIPHNGRVKKQTDGRPSYKRRFHDSGLYQQCGRVPPRQQSTFTSLSKGYEGSIANADEVLEDVPPPGHKTYKLQWSIIRESKSYMMSQAPRSAGLESSKAGTSENVRKESQKYRTHYLHPRGVRINQEIVQNELAILRKYLGSPTNEQLRATLGTFYLNSWHFLPR
jgi:hypothetical protein